MNLNYPALLDCLISNIGQYCLSQVEKLINELASIKCVRYTIYHSYGLIRILWLRTNELIRGMHIFQFPTPPFFFTKIPNFLIKKKKKKKRRKKTMQCNAMQFRISRAHSTKKYHLPA